MEIFTSHLRPSRPTAVAMGLFDGLHPGHQAVIRRALDCAPALLPTVFSFFFDTPATKPDFARILSPTQKEALLSEMGVQGLCCPPFSQIQQLSPEDFFRDILVKQLRAEAVFCGYDFRFGRDAQGDSGLLRQLCGERGIRFEQLPATEEGGLPISSTRIREAIRAGEMEKAARLLGRPYAIDLTVVHGRHMGHDVFGFPTVNQVYEEGDLLPRFGVYESRVHWGGRVYKGVTNVGVKPTVGGDRPSAETFILHFSGDLYGQRPLVSFCRFLRGEMKFPSFEALKAQIRQDAERVENSL